MFAKTISPADQADVLTLLYAVGDAIDAATAVRSPALRERLENARTLLLASYGSLLRSASGRDEALRRYRRAADHEAAVP